jgi:hypothetical protein
MFWMWLTRQQLKDGRPHGGAVARGHVAGPAGRMKTSTQGVGETTVAIRISGSFMGRLSNMASIGWLAWALENQSNHYPAEAVRAAMEGRTRRIYLAQAAYGPVRAHPNACAHD